MLTWEDINYSKGFIVLRAKIFGGWLVTIIADASPRTDSHFRSVKPESKFSITFVPDPDHKWDPYHDDMVV